MTDRAARVLVVEDNEMNMQLVEYLLEEGGYQIVKAASGEDALLGVGSPPGATAR